MELKFIVCSIAILAILNTTRGCNTANTELKFPEFFYFGSTSSAYQIEGASDVDGKGPSIWDDYVKKEGNIADNSTGDDGPDSYYHYKEDVRMLREANLNVYRFSVSWARVLPDGDISSENEKGLQYYDDLINELLLNGILPVITMYHWDLPSRLQDLGGFLNPLIVKYFKEYARLLYSRYGDRVKNWITFNDPNTFCTYAYSSGLMAPGISVVGGEYYCAYHILLSHATAYHLYYDEFDNTFFGGGQVGISLNSIFNYPKDPDNPKDIEAAETANQFDIGLFGHPIFIGHFPKEVRRNVDQFSQDEGRKWSRLPEMDTETINFIYGTADFLGINYYTSRLASPQLDCTAPNISCDARVLLEIDPSWPRAESSWIYSTPERFRSLLVWLKDRYNNVEVRITENGWSDKGEMNDLDRTEVLRQNLEQILLAIHEDNCNVIAYTVWSIVDNFEWMSGFTEKFGIYSFDPKTKERSPKTSVEFLKQVINDRVLPEKISTPSFP